MEIIKIEKNNNYTVIDNCILKDKQISLRAKGLLCVLMSLPPQWNFSVAGLCAIVKESKTAVYSTINELIEAGFCKKTPVRIKGRFAGHKYTFFEQPHTDLPHTDLPHTDLPHTDLPHTDFVPQLNTNINKLNNKLNTNNKDSLSAKNFFGKSLNEKKTAPPHVAPPPPSKEEVLSYFDGKVAYNSDTPQRFYNTMQAGGWCYKGTEIRDWQALADNWIKQEKAKTETNQTKNTYGKSNYAKSEEHRANRIAELWRLADS